MYDGENIKSFTDKLIVLENQLTYHGEKKSNSQVVQKILISLPAKFDSIVSVLEQTRDLDSLTMTELIGILKAHEARLSARDESTNEGAFNARTKARETGSKQDNTRSHENQGRKWCEFCKRSSHTNEECWKKPSVANWHKSSMNKSECYNCGKVGHFSRECRLKKYERAEMVLEDEEEKVHKLFSASEVSAKINEEDMEENYAGNETETGYRDNRRRRGEDSRIAQDGKLVTEITEEDVKKFTHSTNREPVTQITEEDVEEIHARHEMGTGYRVNRRRREKDARTSRDGKPVAVITEEDVKELTHKIGDQVDTKRERKEREWKKVAMTTNKDVTKAHGGNVRKFDRNSIKEECWN